MQLHLRFNEQDDFRNAVKHFDHISNYYADDIIDEFNTLAFNVSDQLEADELERELERELISNGNDGFYFELEESKKVKGTMLRESKTKRILQRIVEHVVKKKLNENTKVVLFDLTVYPRKHHDPKQPSKIKIPKGEKIEIIEHSFKKQANDSLIKYKGKEWVAVKSSLDLSVGLNESNKRRLKESGRFTINDLEDHIYKNIPEIKREMKDYGWNIDDIGKIRNYIDLANVLNIDSNKIKDVELKMYAEIAQDIIRQNIDEIDPLDDY